MSTTYSLNGLPVLVLSDAYLAKSNLLASSGGRRMEEIVLPLFVDFASDETRSHIWLDVVALSAHHPA